MKDNKDFKDLEERVFDLECKCNLYDVILTGLSIISVLLIIFVVALTYFLYKNQVI